MPLRDDTFTQHQLKRWTRPDAHRFVRPDWRRYARPGHESEFLFSLYECKYKPDQPRVPSGSPAGGQWTSDNATSSSSTRVNEARVQSDRNPDELYKPGAQLAQNGKQSSEPVRLEEEELRGGHTIEAHVNRSEEALKAQALEALVANPKAQDSRSGSFSSLATANKLVNSTLAQNADVVGQVVSGIRDRAIAISQFASVTGIEAVAPNARSEPYIRQTYGVGVVIIHDRYASRGFRVLTAFPTNRLSP